MLVEDIVDTGLTLAYLTSQLAAREPASRCRRARCSTAPAAGSCRKTLRYRGVELADEFVLGYGLHVRDLYRNLPFIVVGGPGGRRGRRPIATSTQLYAERPGGPREPGGSGDRRSDTRTEAL